MTTYATMRQLQREGGKLIKAMLENDKLVLTSRGQPVAEVKLKFFFQKKLKRFFDLLNRFAGKYTNVKHDLKTLDHEWE